jgi:hypothetical protein
MLQYYHDLRKKSRGVFASVKPFIIPSAKVKILQIANFFWTKTANEGAVSKDWTFGRKFEKNMQKKKLFEWGLRQV